MKILFEEKCLKRESMMGRLTHIKLENNLFGDKPLFCGTMEVI